MTMHRPVLSQRSPISPATDFWLVCSCYSERACVHFDEQRHCGSWDRKTRLGYGNKIFQTMVRSNFLFFLSIKKKKLKKLQRVRLLQRDVSLKSRSRPPWSVKLILRFGIFYVWSTAKVNGRQDHWPRRLLAVKITDREGYWPSRSLTVKVILRREFHWPRRSWHISGWKTSRQTTSKDWIHCWWHTYHLMLE